MPRAGDGGFHQTSAAHAGLPARPRDVFDRATPSGNALAIAGLFRLHVRTGDPAHRSAAEEALADSVTRAAAAARHAPTLMAVLGERLATAAGGRGGAADGGGVVRVSATAPEAVAPGGEFVVDVRVSVAPGWHVPAHESGVPERAGLRVEGVGGPVEVVGADYPPGRARPAIAGRPPLSACEGEVVVRLRCRVEAGVSPGRLAFRVAVRAQPCGERSCGEPVRLVAEATTRVGDVPP